MSWRAFVDGPPVHIDFESVGAKSLDDDFSLVGRIGSRSVRSCVIRWPSVAWFDGALVLDRVGRGARLDGWFVVCREQETLDRANEQVRRETSLAEMIRTTSPDKIVWADVDIEWSDEPTDIASFSVTRPDATSAEATYIRQPAIPQMLMWAAGAAIAWMVTRK